MNYPKLQFLKGDATTPIKKPAMIVHITNDLGMWGSGFVLAITKRFGKGPESSYRLWAQSKEDFRLGQVRVVPVTDDISVANMIAQSGLISKDNPKPLNLKALRICLKHIYSYLKGTNTTVHMPRIGCGLAGGKWEEIEPIIKKLMTVDTYVYDFA